MINYIALFRPKKNYLRLEIKHPKAEEIDKLIETYELDEMGYDSRWGAYRIRFTKDDIKNKEGVLRDLLEKAEIYFNE